MYFISLFLPLVPLFINFVPICFMTFYQKRQTKINATSISNVFVPCVSHFSFFFFTLGAFTIESHPRNENVIKIIILDEQLCPFIMLFNGLQSLLSFGLMSEEKIRVKMSETFNVNTKKHKMLCTTVILICNKIKIICKNLFTNVFLTEKSPD